MINDILGYSLGNEFIKMISKELIGFTTQTIRLYHTSIDEFVLTVEDDISIYVLRRLARDLLELFGKNINFANRKFYVTTCIGLVQKDQKMKTTEDLYRATDMALGEAKAKGRNQIAFYDEQMYIKLKAINEKEQEFAYALKHDQFILHYQPKVNLKTGLVESMEALIRWEHPEKGIIYPNEFIDFAEKSGLIIQLGDLVVKKVCKQMMAWEKEGERARLVSFNISLRQLAEPDFVYNIKKMINEYKVDPKFMEIEITESMFIDESTNPVKKLKQLREFGLQIAMDDFGSGYSSLNLINLMPLDVLKIDVSLIRSCTTSKKSALLLETIISMAHKLDLDVVAEGVDTDEQKEKMIQLKCDYIQGYYYSMPLPAESFVEYSKSLE